MTERTTIQAIDGYDMVPIPDAIVEQLGLQEGDVMDVRIEDGKLVLTKAAPPPVAETTAT